MRVTIEATYRVVTPLFCAGTEAGRPQAHGVPRQPGKPKLRLASFKGTLRFWWRALAWSRYDGDLAAIRSNENALFGSTDRGQSRVLMRLASATRSPKPILVGEILKVPGTNQVVGEGARYLGYGVMEAFGSKARGTEGGQLTRACLLAPSMSEATDSFEFTVQMRGRGLDKTSLDLLEKALIALGTLGGMGARSRKGYGSLVLQALCIEGRKQGEQWRKPQSMEELRDAIASLGGKENSTKLPEFTALSDQARHVLIPSVPASGNRVEPVELLDLVGRELIRFRSWGRNGKVFGRDSEKRFEDDHDLMKMDRRRRNTHPRWHVL